MHLVFVRKDNKIGEMISVFSDKEFLTLSTYMYNKMFTENVDCL